MEDKRFNHVDPKILRAIAFHSHNRKLPAELVRIYISDVGNLLERFHEAQEERDLEKIQFLAHRIKGSALNVGAVTMAENCAAIEKSLGEKLDWNHLCSQIKQLKSNMKLTTQEFHQLLRDS